MVNVNLNQQRKKRTGFRALGNRALDTALQLLDEEGRQTSVLLQSTIDILQRHLSKIADLDDKIIDLLVDDDDLLEADMQEASDIHDRFSDCITRLHDRKATIQQITIPQTPNIIPDLNQPQPAKATARLPQLELPKFAGDPLQWSSFWDSYESAIHTNPTLSSVDKFNYMRSLLKGKAEDSIAGIAITNANYDTAVDLIKERFGQPQAIINAHVTALMEIPRATSDITKLRMMYDSCEIHIRGLETLNITSQAYGAIMTPIIMSKVPEDINLIITRKHGSAIGDLDELRKLLKMEIEARELSHVSKKTNKSSLSDSEETFTTGSLVINSNGKKCQFCGNNRHFAEYCDQYVTTDQRQTKASKDKRCFNCLRTDHHVQDCSSHMSCRQCGMRHHTALCQRDMMPSSNRDQFATHHYQRNGYQRPRDLLPSHSYHRQGPQVNSNQRSFMHSNDSRRNMSTNLVQAAQDLTLHTTASTPALLSTTNTLLMQTALAKVQDIRGNYKTIRLLFDTASHRSYMTQSLFEKLDLAVKDTEFLSIGSFGQQKSAPQRQFNVTTIECVNLDGSSQRSLSTVVVPSITCPIFRAPLSPKMKGILSNLKLADPSSPNSQWMDVDVLVGLDHYWEVVQDEIIRLPDSALTAVSSIFGWLVSGKLKEPSFASSQTNSLFVSTMAVNDNFLKTFWESESLQFAEIKAKDEYDLESDTVLQSFNTTIKWKNDRYEVGLPWKTDHPNLPTNYHLCRKRFFNLITRLQRDKLTSAYNDVITQQIKKDFIEKVDHPEESSGMVHYISHHPVIKNDRATTKLRIVYDASAKQSSKDPSLNECLHTGPNLVAKIMTLLLEFRMPKLVLLADVEKAFLQVSLQPYDRDATRFLWLKDPNKPVNNDNIQTFRFRRVLFGATSSPFLLAATIRYHLQQSTDPVADEMLNKFYVDNLIIGKDSITEAKLFYTKAKHVMAKAGMNLREWISNSQMVMNFIPPVDRASGEIFKVLGVPWNINDDVLHVKAVPELENSMKITKRLILQTIAKVFDLLGLVSPIVMPAKVMIQHLWKTDLNWDDEPPEHIVSEWKVMNKQFSRLNEIKVPRFLPVSASSQLHVFVDASLKAYAAVAYLININDDELTSNLICSKSRVSPIKEVTIPRLELMAVLMGTQLASFIKQVCHISSVYIWSDSKVVLHWIKSQTEKQGIFVRNRVKQINAYNLQYRYCPTKENPADLPSRGSDIASIRNNRLWWHGPMWLAQDQSNWPVNILDENRNQEVISDELPTVTAKVTISEEVSPYDMSIKRYNSMEKLLRVTSYCTRFVKHIRRSSANTGPITADEYVAARLMWIKTTQLNNFPEEFYSMKVKKPNLFVRQLRLFLAEDVIRTGGRFRNSELTTAENNPILLPKNNYFVDLCVMECHQKLFHQGVRHCLTRLRETYWIPNGRQQVRSVLKKCSICRFWEGGSYQQPLSPPLPAMRLTRNPAFTYTGCDFAGPLYVLRNGSQQKVWICLFTCAVTRAVHLELVTDMSSHCFLMSLRRFISRRGVPREIISDNAKTFKLTKSVLERLWHNVIISDDTISYISAKGIHWKFNVERAPWWGGFFERMVGLVKRSLIKSVGKTKLGSEEVETILSEIEAILNTRPITYVYSNQSDGQPLSPSNFLAESNVYGFPTPAIDLDPEYADPHCSANSLLKKLRHRQLILDRFWNTWLREYLSTIREFHHQWDKKAKTIGHGPSKGDVVLIKEDGIKRAHWKTAVVKHLYKGTDDNKVRAVQLSCGDKLLQRPVSLLYPLEIESHQSGVSTETEPQLQDKGVCKRPKRKAALRANELIHGQYDQDDDA